MSEMAGLRFSIVLAFCLATSFAFELTIEPNKSEYDHLENRELFLICNVLDVDNKADVLIKWLHDGKQMQDNRSFPLRTPHGLTRVFSKTTDTDSGSYTCVANVNGRVKKQTVKVTIIEAVKFVENSTEQHPEEGQDARISCRVKNIVGEMNVIWRRMNDKHQLNRDHPRGYTFIEDDQVLVIGNFTAAKDNGVYSCHVYRLIENLPSIEQLDITVIGFASPRIIDFEAPVIQGYEDGNLNLTCRGVGYPPPEYTWHKGSVESAEFKSSSKYDVSANGHLIIRSLVEDDAGQYTCLVRNKAGLAQNTTNVRIFHKPIIERMDNVTARKNRTVELRCAYSGDGDIGVEWSSDGRTFGDRETENSRVFVRTEHQVSILTLHNVTLSDAADYRCKATNQAGTRHRLLTLQIEYAPIFDQKTIGAVRSVAGKQVSFFCRVEAVPTPIWQWFGPNGRKIEPDAHRYFIEEQRDHLISTLKLKPKSLEDYGTYRCESRNSLGVVAETVHVLRIVIPPVPSRLVFDGNHPNFARLLMSSNFTHLDEGALPTDIVFLFTTLDNFRRSNFNWTHADFVDVPYANDTPTELHGLKPTTDYRVRVQLKNEAGSSHLSPIFNYTTTSPLPPSTPIFLRDSLVDSTNECSSSSCRIEWFEPNNHGAFIMHYLLTVYPLAMASNRSFSSVKSPLAAQRIPSDQLEWTLDNLPSNSYFRLNLVAINAEGASQAGEIVIKTDASVDSGLSPWAILVLLAFISLLFFIIIDVFCYQSSNCGLLSCICVNCLGQSGQKTKELELPIDENVKMESTKLIDEKTAGVETNVNGVNNKSSKSTTV